MLLPKIAATPPNFAATPKIYHSRKGIVAMKADVIIDQDTQKVKLIFDWAAGKIGERLTADEVEIVTKLVEQKLYEAGREVFKAWLMQHECHADVTVIDGKTYRFKIVSEKKFPVKSTLYHKNGDNYPHLASCKMAFVAFRCINRRSRNISRAIRFST
jgi:hypothetical protein